jgi:hypothetical protein
LSDTRKTADPTSVHTSVRLFKIIGGHNPIGYARYRCSSPLSKSAPESRFSGRNPPMLTTSLPLPFS